MLFLELMDHDRPNKRFSYFKKKSGNVNYLTLKTVLKVEGLFKENIEFGSKNQLLRKLAGSMKAPVLNVILKYLKGIGKVIDNEDGSWTWIYAADNKKLKKSYGQAAKL